MTIRDASNSNPWAYPERTAAGVRNHFVYYVYDELGEVIYIGCTRSPSRRWKQHKRWNPAMVAAAYYCRMAGPYDFATARQVEKYEQYKYRPRFDARHPNRWSKKEALLLQFGGKPGQYVATAS